MLNFRNFINESNFEIDPYSEENWGEEDPAQNYINVLYNMYIRIRKDDDKRLGAVIIAKNARTFIDAIDSDINNWKRRFNDNPYVIEELDKLD